MTVYAETPMEAKAAGSVFWAFFPVLFPVAAQLLSLGCVTYEREAICGLKGSSVEFPCHYPKNSEIVSIPGWSKRLHPVMKPKPLKEMPDFASRMKLLEHGNNDCTMKLEDLKTSDASDYFFIYLSRNESGHRMKCNGVPGVWLHILLSPVSIQVEGLVRGQDVPVADWTVMEGQGIRLSCVPTCAAKLNSNPGYIWYKNNLQLNGSAASSPYLSLDPISSEDTGSYVCVSIGHKDFPSSAVNLRVQRRPKNVVDNGFKMHSVPTRTYGCDAPDSSDGNLNKDETPKSKGMFTFSVMLGVSVCVGLVIALLVTVLVLKGKRKRERRKRCAGSVPVPSNPDSDIYMSLDINSMSAEYHTLDTVRNCSTADADYEHICTSD